MQIKKQDLLILETYSSKELAYDGLSGVFKTVTPIGTVVADSRTLSGKTVLVCGIAPLYEHKISLQNTNVIITTFESDLLPEHWVAAINRYKHCIVPHPAIEKMFISSGVNIPTTVIHNGYQRYNKKQVKKEADGCFRVGFLGIPVNRKNLNKLYEACKLLQQTLIPELKLHIHVATFYDWLPPGPFEKMKEDEIVCWTTGKYSIAETSEWYHQLDCYIFPSSGEGWSYTPRESMYLGIPTIITDIPVHDELVQSGFYSVIPPSGQIAADFNGAVFGNWENIEVEEIKKAILDVYQRKDHYQHLAERGAAWITCQWENEDIGNRILHLIETI